MAQAGANSCGADVNTAPSQSPSRTAGAMLCLINAERTRAGVRPATLSQVAQLNGAAQGHADAAASLRWWTRGADFHVNPQTRSTPSSRIAASGYCSGRPRTMGEITFTGYGSGGATPLAAMRAWLNSAGHRARILDRSYSQVGIGIAGRAANPAAGSNPPQGTYVVVFGACSR